ncbi:unnamed protein product, partial [Prorocentrum cordatum]
EIMGFSAAGEQVVVDRPGAVTAASRNVAWQQIVSQSSQLVTFIDLCGHEKYLKTTIFGLVGLCPDYAMVIVNANAGFQKMSREHLGIALALKIPFIFVVTKIDIAPTNVYEENLEMLSRIVKSKAVGKIPLKLQREEDLGPAAEGLESDRVCPIFCISSVTGEGLPLLKSFMQRSIPHAPQMVTRSPRTPYASPGAQLARAVPLCLAAACTAVALDPARGHGAGAAALDVALVQVGLAAEGQQRGHQRQQRSSAGAADRSWSRHRPSAEAAAVAQPSAAAQPSAVAQPATAAAAQPAAGADAQGVGAQGGQEKAAAAVAAEERQRQLQEMVGILAAKSELRSVWAMPREQLAQRGAHRGRGLLTADEQILRLGGGQLLQQQDLAEQQHRNLHRLVEEEQRAVEAEDPSEQPVVISDVESDSSAEGDSEPVETAAADGAGTASATEEEDQEQPEADQQQATEEQAAVEQPPASPAQAAAAPPPPVHTPPAAPAQPEGVPRVAAAPAASVDGTSEASAARQGGASQEGSVMRAAAWRALAEELLAQGRPQRARADTAGGEAEQTGAVTPGELEAGLTADGSGWADVCEDDLGCSLNGECREGRCVCDAAWSGSANCSVLALLPAKRRAGYGAINSSTSSWGAGVVYDPVGKRFVMIAEEMDMGCGLQTWNLNSRCIVADSPTVDGEYAFRGVVVDAWAHSCAPARDPVSGIWVVSHLGAGDSSRLPRNQTMASRCSASSASACTAGPGQREHCALRQNSRGSMECSVRGCTGGCSGGTTPALGEPRAVVPCSGGGNAFNESVTAGSPYGPWQASRRLHFGLHGGTDPWFLPNGTLLSITSSGLALGAAHGVRREGPRANRPSILRAESLAEAREGGWVRLPWRSVLAGSGHEFSSDESAWPQVHWEDHHIFTDRRGNYHILAHARSGPLPACSAASAAASPACGARIGHAFSRNAEDWHVSPVAAATAESTFEDGETVRWRARERPRVVQDGRGHLVALVTGVGDPHCGGANAGVAGCDHTFTLVERVRAGPAA